MDPMGLSDSSLPDDHNGLLVRVVSGVRSPHTHAHTHTHTDSHTHTPYSHTMTSEKL